MRLLPTASSGAASHAGADRSAALARSALSGRLQRRRGLGRFERGLQIALTIPRPEARADALLRIAEAAGRATDPRAAATAYLPEAARAVASIPLDDPRAILAGVLIDSLISVGRFDDARAASSSTPNAPRRLIALGAVAESQGAPRAWPTRRRPGSTREVPPEIPVPALPPRQRRRSSRSIAAEPRAGTSRIRTR